MGYYDQDFLNYYYYMASQFALSDRWFSPVASKSTPNRVATLSGGTTQGLTRDPFVNDGITESLPIASIFEELDQAKVSWKILLRYHRDRLRAAKQRDSGLCRLSGHACLITSATMSGTSTRRSPVPFADGFIQRRR